MSKQKVTAKLSLPSQHQIGDNVLVSFYTLFPINDSTEKDYNFAFSEKVTETTVNFEAEVIAVHFFPAKVKYDIEITTKEFKTRIYNLDSLLIFKK